MYVQVIKKLKCSKCGAIDQYETVIKRDGTKIIRCLECKHKKRTPPPITTTVDSGKTIWYNTNISDEELF